MGAQRDLYPSTGYLKHGDILSKSQFTFRLAFPPSGVEICPRFWIRSVEFSA